MKVALIAPIHIPVPPITSGGTELFIATLAEGLVAQGVEVDVFCHSNSTVAAKTIFLQKFPPKLIEVSTQWQSIDEINHLATVFEYISDYRDHYDVIHINSPLAAAFYKASNIGKPCVCTVHHPYEEDFKKIYDGVPCTYVYLSSSHEKLSQSKAVSLVINHGIDLTKYKLETEKEDYLCFLGRLSADKGIHTAIALAERLDDTLKLAGAIPDEFPDYDSHYLSYLEYVEYLGEVNLEKKNELLGKAKGLIFPIQWDEPFGLVMIEAMACGTPVFAYDRGSVREIVTGSSGRICKDFNEMVDEIQKTAFNPHKVRRNVETRFSQELMSHRYLELYQSLLLGKTI